MAKRASKQTNRTVGLVLRKFSGLFGSYFVGELLKGVGEAVQNLKSDLLLHILPTSRSDDWDETDLLDPDVTVGVLLADIEWSEPMMPVLEERGIPYVVMNNYFPSRAVNCVGIDNAGGGRLVAEYLVGLGHERVGTIAGNQKTQAGRDRLEGFRSALRNQGLPLAESYIAVGDFSRESGHRGMEELLKQEAPPTAVFVASDEMALGALQVILELGLKVPEDVSIIGFDDSLFATSGSIQLTTVRQPVAQMGRTAAQMLADLIYKRKQPPLKVLLSTSLVERESCRRI